MKKLIIYTKKIYMLLIIMFFLIWNISFWQSDESDDLMYQVFKEAISYWSILEVWWKTSDDVWHEVLRWKTSIWAWESLGRVCLNPENNEILYVYDNNERLVIDNEEDCAIAWWVWDRDIIDVTYTTPLIARITKILLSITMILAITMIIFTSVKLMVKILVEGNPNRKDLVKDIKWIIIWVLLALFSVTIINLLRSVTESSINTTYDDNDELSFGCDFAIDGEPISLPQNNFKEYICLNEIMSYDDLEDREFRYIQPYEYPKWYMEKRGLWQYRCKVNVWWTYKRVIIKTSKAKEYCKTKYNWRWGFMED